MKIFLSLIFIFQTICAFTQTEKDTSNLSISITAYAFPKSVVYTYESIAMGPTFYLNDNKFPIQFGLLFDLRTYTAYSIFVSPQSYEKSKAYHFFFPILFHYTAKTTRKIDFIFSGGLLFESRPLETDIKGYMNFSSGLGIKYKFTKSLSFKATPALQMTNRILPGIFLDLTYSFNVLRALKKE